MRRRRVRQACPLTMAVAAAVACMVVLPATAGAAADGGLKACKSGELYNLQTDGTAKPIDDDFSKPDNEIWCNEIWGDASLRFGNGLTLHQAPSPSLSNPVANNAEIGTITTFRPGEAMSVRIDGADLTAHQGQFGWGLWNRHIDVTTSEIGWFIYQHSDVITKLGPLGKLLAPDGFFIMTNSLGHYPTIKYLDPNLIKGTHTYSIVLTKGTVDYLIDGKSVGRFTDPKAIPTAKTPLNVE